MDEEQIDKAFIETEALLLETIGACLPEGSEEEFMEFFMIQIAPVLRKMEEEIKRLWKEVS